MAIKTSELNARLFGKADKRKATTQQEAQQAVADKTPFIELSVAGEMQAQFELIRVPASDVAIRTLVFNDNAREQSFLNELALADILSTLQDKGQQYPAVGRWAEDGHIEVLDGSRRRMACILAKQDFLIYVAHGITTKHAKFLSDVANAHKPLSLYERGKEMQAMLDNQIALDQKELAKVCQCSEALVSGALKAAALPLLLLQAYPSVAELGRPTIVKLYRLYFGLTENQQQQLLAKLAEIPVWQRVDVLGVARITREVTLLIERWCDEITPIAHVDNVAVIDLIAGRANYRRKSDSLAINLKHISEDDAQLILNFIKQQLS